MQAADGDDDDDDVTEEPALEVVKPEVMVEVGIGTVVEDDVVELPDEENGVESRLDGEEIVLEVPVKLGIGDMVVDGDAIELLDEEVGVESELEVEEMMPDGVVLGINAVDEMLELEEGVDDGGAEKIVELDDEV